MANDSDKDLYIIEQISLIREDIAELKSYIKEKKECANWFMSVLLPLVVSIIVSVSAK